MKETFKKLRSKFMGKVLQQSKKQHPINPGDTTNEMKLRTTDPCTSINPFVNKNPVTPYEVAKVFYISDCC
jgi:hypothetical protein